MKPDYIVRMAKNDYGIYAFTEKTLELFIALVAAAEREACAEICDREAAAESNLVPFDRCAVLIRARGDQ